MKVMLPRIQPINPLRIKAPVDDADFISEGKHDGFRALAYIEGGSCKLISRKQVVYKSRPFVSLCALLGELPVRDGILDGELVYLDADGRSQFMELMRRRKDGHAITRSIYSGSMEPICGKRRSSTVKLNCEAGPRQARHTLCRSSPRCCLRHIPGLLRSGSGGNRDQGGARAIQPSALLLAKGDQSKLQPAQRPPGNVRAISPAHACLTVKLLSLEGSEIICFWASSPVSFGQKSLTTPAFISST